jgi:hypothetical protein
MLCRVVLVWTDVSKGYMASIIRVVGMSELGTTLGVSINWSTLQRNNNCNYYEKRSSKTSVLTRVTLRHIGEDSILQGDGIAQKVPDPVYSRNRRRIRRFNWTVSLDASISHEVQYLKQKWELHSKCNFSKLRKTNSAALSPRANYTDWATATCRRNLVPTFADRGVSRGRGGGSPSVVNLSFLDRSRYFTFK